jgi:hypothetical protein
VTNALTLAFEEESAGIGSIGASLPPPHPVARALANIRTSDEGFMPPVYAD